MSKTTIIQHFSDQGVLNTMSAEAKCALFGRFSDFMARHEVDLSHGWPDDDNDAALLNRIKEVLINLHTDNDDAAQLGEYLDDISKINEYAADVQRDLDFLSNKYVKAMESFKDTHESALSTIVALCIAPEAREDITLLVTRLSLREKKNYKDFPWNSGVSKESEDEGELDERFIPRQMMQIENDQAQTEEAINAEFTNRKYHTKCHVEVYPTAEDGQMWAIIEHGGQSLTIETYEDGKASTRKILPLMRDAVVLDTAHKVLRVHTAHAWKEKLYREKFSKLFMGNEQAFHDGVMYTFDPIKKKGLPDAFSRSGWDNLRSVSVVKIETVKTDDGQRVYQSLRSQKDVSETWRKTRNAYGEIVSITLELKINGAKRNVRVSIRETRGLCVSDSKYTASVREWLRRQGFELGYYTLPYAPCEEEGMDAENNDIIFWQQVHAIWNAGKISRSTMSRRYSPRVVSFLMNDFMIAPPNPEYDDVWYSESGRAWDVYQDGTDFYYYDKAEETLPDYNHKIPVEHIELLHLDRDAFVNKLAYFINGKRPSSKSYEKHGIYDLGRCNRLDIQVYLYVSQINGDQGFTPVRKRFRCDDAEVAFLSFDAEPPEVYRDDVDEDHIQFGAIWELVTYRDGKLVATGQIHEFFHRPNRQEIDGVHRYWHKGFPKSPSFHHISINIGTTHTWIRYGEEEHTYTPGSLPMFYDSTAGKAAVTGIYGSLAKAIRYNDAHPEGFLLKDLKAEIPESSLNDLAIELKRFFGIGENFYELIPEDRHRQRGGRYRLAFASAKIID